MKVIASSSLCLLLLGAVLVIPAAEANLRTLEKKHGATTTGQKTAATSFVKPFEFKHRLRVCNAYPYAAALDLFRGQSEKMTTDSPLHYKGCKDFHSQLQAGDKLEFKVGDANAGTFSVSELPKNDATLLLVIYRRDVLSTAVAFESHVFSNAKNAQLAVLDTYRGSERARLKIQDADAAAAEASKGTETAGLLQEAGSEASHKGRSEELRYDSVVAVQPGKYAVSLVGLDGETKSSHPLVALGRESYAVIRVGVDAQQGPSYKQELIVFPESDPSMFSGATSSLGRTSAAALLVSLITATASQLLLL